MAGDDAIKPRRRGGLPPFPTLSHGVGQPVVTVLPNRPFRLSRLAASTKIGVYVLVCDMRDSSPEIYVGMASSLRTRLGGHARFHDFSATVRGYVVTSDADAMSPSEARLVERLILCALAKPDATIVSLNDETPVGATTSFERYCGWRVFAGAALLLLARDPALAEVATPYALLGGCDLPIIHRDSKQGLPQTGGFRMVLRHPDVSATAIQFRSASGAAGKVTLPAVLEAGSEIRLRSTASMPVGALICQYEARFAGLVREIRPGVGLLLQDLAFCSVSMMTGFVLASTKGQTHWWANEASARKARRRATWSLSAWRSGRAPGLGPEHVAPLRSAIESCAIFGQPRWSRAKSRDAASAIYVALSVTRDAYELAPPIDLAMTALLAHVLEGDAGAASVMHHILSKLRTRGVLSDQKARVGKDGP